MHACYSYGESRDGYFWKEEKMATEEALGGDKKAEKLGKRQNGAELLTGWKSEIIKEFTEIWAQRRRKLKEGLEGQQ